MATSPPLPPLEAAWQSLRPPLEWGDSFSLVFVFNGNDRQKEALYERAVDLMRAQAKTVQRPKPRYADDLARHLLGTLLEPSPAMLRSGMPLWLDLDSHPEDEKWNEARRAFLLRLNERRSMLAREHTRPVVLVLPADWTKQAAEAAPDLWTIRQPSIFLAPGADSMAETLHSPTFRNEKPLSPPRADAALPAASRRWQADFTSHPEQISVWDGIQAANAALQAGFAMEAHAIAGQAVDHARNAAKPRDLSVALDTLGDIDAALGRLDAARAAYGESESLCRRLLDDFGPTPERLR
ncbi:MAG: hypothetical protein H6R10_2582, partial [Rhodocyclaceae bacterium]|nr:hypothetical protein [Rhodocyclaceae bacterium]